MRIITKRIKVIAMTEEEMRKFQELVARAAEGHMSHYAEDKLDDGSYLGVSVLTAEEKRDLDKADSERRESRYQERIDNGKSRY